MKFFLVLLSLIFVSCQGQDSAELAKQAEFRAGDPLAQTEDCDDEIDLTEEKTEVVDLSGENSDEGCTLKE